MTAGERMRLRRKEIGMSAEKLAELLGKSPATIYRYENGDIEKMPVDFLGPLSQALHTTPAILMGWTDEDCSDSQSPPLLASITSSEEKLLSLHRQLNDEGQARLRDYADDLVSSGKYIKSDPLGLVAK